MADEHNLQDRTEQATPKRREDARRRGQVARSRELNIAAILLAGTMTMMAARTQLVGALETLMRNGLSISPAMLDDPSSIIDAFAHASLGTLRAFAPLLIALAVAATLGALAVGGWVFSTEHFAPQWSRLDPLQGLKRMVSLRSLVEVAKAVIKGLLIGSFAAGYLLWSRNGVIGLGLEPLQAALGDSGTMLGSLLMVCSFGMLVVACADVPFQIWSHNRELRMTRQEIRDELKESEGRPEVRSRLRALQQQVANRRMLRDVPTADVVVTNPTHFAVALRYQDGRMRAPVVVAKGVDHMAARIREVATKHRVALFEAPLLARALYWTTDPGREIPAPLYLAVAQVLTYVYRLKAATQGNAPWPDRPVVRIDTSLAEPQRGRRANGR